MHCVDLQGSQTDVGELALIGEHTLAENRGEIPAASWGEPQSAAIQVWQENKRIAAQVNWVKR